MYRFLQISNDSTAFVYVTQLVTQSSHFVSMDLIKGRAFYKERSQNFSA